VAAARLMRPLRGEDMQERRFLYSITGFSYFVVCLFFCFLLFCYGSDICGPGFVVLLAMFGPNLVSSHRCAAESILQGLSPEGRNVPIWAPYGLERNRLADIDSGLLLAVFSSCPG
jgi:hypothetical protein